MLRAGSGLVLATLILGAPLSAQADLFFWKKKTQPACPPRAVQPVCPPVQLAPPVAPEYWDTPRPDEPPLPPSPNAEDRPGDARPEQPAPQPPAARPQQNLNVPQQNLSTSRSSGAQSAAPNMIGDLFGTGSGTTASVLVDRFNAVSVPFNDANPTAGVLTPYTGGANGVSLTITNSNLPVTIFNTNLDVDFTTLDSEDALFNGGAGDYQIINSAAVQGAAQGFGESLYGSGSAVFVPGADSYVTYAPLGPDSSYTPYWAYDYYANIQLPDLAGAPGAMVGRSKLGENTSPIPRDRVYINYSYFDNTPLAAGGVNVNRVTPGFEKTFFDGNMSFEFRTPFATTLDSTINQGGVTNTNNAEFGNITMYLKALLYNNDVFALSAGMGLAVPTADDVVVNDNAGTAVVRIENQSVHLLPFVGALYTPNDRLFMQSFLQLDIDANGNPVLATDFVNGGNTGNLSRIGRPHDFTYLFADFSVGYWLFLDPSSDRLITGVAPIVEYHLNQTIGGSGGASGVSGGTAWNINGPQGISTSNGVVGLTGLIRNDATVTVAYATPLHSSDAQFDGEVRVMFNWLFGNSKPVSRFTRAPAF